MIFGNASFAHDRMGVYLEGVQVDDVTTAKSETVTGIYTVAVTDGKLTIRLHDLGGDDAYVAVVAIEIMGASGPANQGATAEVCSASTLSP